MTRRDNRGKENAPVSTEEIGAALFHDVKTRVATALY